MARCEIKLSPAVYAWLNRLPPRTFNGVAGFLDALVKGRGQSGQNPPVATCGGRLRYVIIDVRGFAGSVFFYVTDEDRINLLSLGDGVEPSDEAIARARAEMEQTQANGDDASNL